LLQLLAPARMRGRVLAIFDVVRLGLVPVGSVVAGAVVDRVGAATVLQVYGVLTVAAVVATAILYRPLLSVDPDAEPIAASDRARPGADPPSPEPVQIHFHPPDG
jgi:hypothetical protein